MIVNFISLQFFIPLSRLSMAELLLITRALTLICALPIITPIYLSLTPVNSNLIIKELKQTPLPF